MTGDATDLPFREGTFDIVIANDSMEHFSRVMRAGGSIFLFFTPWGSPLGAHLYDHIHTPWCHLLYSENLLEQLLEFSLQRRGDRDPPGEAARMIEEYRTSNNRIDVAGYHRILEGAVSFETAFEELKPPRFGFLAPPDLDSPPRGALYRNGSGGSA